MKKCKLIKAVLPVLCAGFACASTLADGEEQKKPESAKPDEKILQEAKRSIQKAVNFLTDRQKPDGSWCEHPGITGLVCMALHNCGSTENVEIRNDAVAKGRKYILYFVQKDGSIWMSGKEREFPVYTTSIALAALAVMGNPEDEEVMRNARKYLMGCQLTPDNKDNPTPEDSDVFGGFSYGGSGPVHADLSNTQWALEALHLTDYLDREPKSKNPDDAKKSELAWGNAVKFISRLQNLPESNDESWVIKDPKDPQRGGFVYVSPDMARSGNDGGKPTLRTYGSMTYAGLKSMIYAKLDKNDPRVKAATEWAARNYTLDENPGMGTSGLYYYLQTFGKAHSVIGEETVTTADGQKRPWRSDLLKKLVSLQKETGEWINSDGRWMESIPELVTAYSLLSMESALCNEDLK